MMGCDVGSIRTMKLILYCFEWISGLKINHHKSEVVVFGVDIEEEQSIANILNCKVGRLPMKYLGVPFNDHHLGVPAFEPLPIKIGKKLQPWKGKHMSSGGRVILSNTSLASIPTYMMGMYLLNERIHQKMYIERS